MADLTDIPATNTEDVTPPSDANLTIDDLSTAMQIIQVVGARGAIRAEEMTVVGALYTKLKTFLDAAAAAAAAAAQAKTDAEATEVPEVPAVIPAKKSKNPADEIIGSIKEPKKGKK